MPYTISADRRSCLLPYDKYFTHCRWGLVTIFKPLIQNFFIEAEKPFYRFIFREETTIRLWDNILLRPIFLSVFIKVNVQPTSWIFSVEKPTSFECKYKAGRSCETKELTLKAAGKFQHPEGCVFFAAQYHLQHTASYNCKMAMNTTNILVPRIPSIPYTEEMKSFQTDPERTNSMLQEFELTALETDIAVPITIHSLAQKVQAQPGTTVCRDCVIASVASVLTVTVLSVCTVTWRKNASLHAELTHGGVGDRTWQSPTAKEWSWWGKIASSDGNYRNGSAIDVPRSTQHGRALWITLPSEGDRDQLRERERERERERRRHMKGEGCIVT